MDEIKRVLWDGQSYKGKKGKHVIIPVNCDIEIGDYVRIRKIKVD